MKLANIFKQDDNFLLSNKKEYLYFFFVNIIFYNISTTAHYSYRENYLLFSLFFICSMALVILFKFVNKMSILNIFISYNFSYLLFSLLISVIKFDVIYLVIINIFLFAMIKLYKIIKNLSENKSHFDVILNYHIENDFSNKYTFRNNDLPFQINENEKFRTIDEELELLKKCNDLKKSKIKLTNENIDEYINSFKFNVPKSLILVIYQTILNHTYHNVEEEIIKLKILDETNNVKENSGNYLLEFKIDRNNIVKYTNEINNVQSSIKNIIDGIINITKEEKYDLIIKQGINKNYYVIRIHFEIKILTSDKESISNSFNLINKPKTSLKDLDLSKSTGLTTDYHEDNSDTTEDIKSK